MGSATQPGNQIVGGDGPFFEGKVRHGAKEAKRLYDKGKGFKPYGGKWHINESDATNRALNKMSGTAKEKHRLGNASMDVAQGLMKGRYNPSKRGYKDLLRNTSNRAFESVVDTQAGKLGDDISRQFGGAGFGSAAHSGTLADQIGDFRNQMVSDNWHQNNAMQRGLLSDITGVEQMGVQNRMAGMNAAPGVYDFQYAPHERLAQVGAAREGYDAAKLQGQMNKYNAKQMAPHQQLGTYMAHVGGGGFYGNNAPTVSASGNPWGQGGGGGADINALLGQLLGR
ncbi:hypothetical protein [Bauldia sp.]|uniref:hypothetical protein n=1 Tax=Bauldia sp. TaxID=2575872 RepID=UPI003BAA5DE5